MSVNKINEAPIPYDELPQSGHYLAGKDKAIIIKREITNDINNVLDMIKRMSWRDIVMSNSGDKYTAILPRTIITAMNAILSQSSPAFSKAVVRDNISDAINIANQQFKNTFVTGGSYCFKGVNGGYSSIYMKIDSSQRTHFPNDGINSALRGTGLGKKMYRALIEQKPWVVTNSGGSEIKNWMWASLTHEQFDEQGNRDRDAEIYSFRFADNLFAVSTTRPDCIDGGYTVINKISDKSKLASKQLRKANNIGIDADFIQLCREKASTNAKAQQILDWVEPSPESLARIEAQRQRDEQERIERERAENERRSVGLRDRLQAYCGVTNINDLSSDWNVGDWIVLREYLLQADYSNLPIRKVEQGSTPNTYKAYTVIDRGNNGARELTVNRPSDKLKWVKTLPPASGHNFPPGINGVPTRAARMDGGNTTTQTTTSTASTGSVNNFIDVERIFNRVNNLPDNAADNNNTYNAIARRQKQITNNALGLGLYVPNSQLLTQAYKMNNTPIYGYIIGDTYFINSKTSVAPNVVSINDRDSKNFIIQNSTKYNLRRVVEKTELSSGDLVYIGGHSKYYGYVAKVIRTALTARGDKYVYLSVPGAGRNNRLTLTPRALYKLIPSTNESIDIPFITSLNEFKNYIK